MSTRKKIILSLFILFHLTTCTLYLLPDSYIQQKVTPLVRPYIHVMGFGQVWNMFSPDPGNLNIFIFARILQNDGTTWEYWLPQLSKMGWVDRYEKFRIIMYTATVHVDSSEYLWPDLAGWIAEQDRRQTGKRPLRIRLYRTWWNVPAPPADTSKRPVPVWNTYLFFEMKFPAEDKQKRVVAHGRQPRME